MYEIELQYFTPNGKYYTEGIYNTEKEYMFEVLHEVKQMKKDEKLPCISGSNWIVYVNAEKHPSGYPLLIL